MAAYALSAGIWRPSNGMTRIRRMRKLSGDGCDSTEHHGQEKADALHLVHPASGMRHSLIRHMFMVHDWRLGTLRSGLCRRTEIAAYVEEQHL